MSGPRSLALAPGLLLLALAAGCHSGHADEPVLTPDERAEVKKIIDGHMGRLPQQVQLSAAQRADARPFVEASARELFAEARRYHEAPSPDARRRLDARARTIWEELKRDLQPLMTSAQLYNFMAALDRAMQDVRAAGLSRP